ncbi:hypothetical protein EK21DRAFT_101214 [Setomelanomma holmii]|uniref:Zn(2)-C6 fungal-type domain-containing protein n=1 Tax=Setomelanomma holmii TaxID=210430 RepID=A0A9P4LM95_9PLEO|nr:hypothetical protein EK21DRAFT_101214 [Setomelanomma holmii]
MNQPVGGDTTDQASTQSRIGEVVVVSCEQCPQRKVKCDRRKPCSRCLRAKEECVVLGTGERSRPTSKKYIRVLENKISTLEQFISRLATADEATRILLLNNSPSLSTSPKVQSPLGHRVTRTTIYQGLNGAVPSVSTTREGRMCKHSTSTCTQFYGGTSLFQMDILTQFGNAEHFSFHPKDETCPKLIANFFQNCYPFNMHVYREWFLRDYHAGQGPYYFDTLLFTICAAGALITPDSSQQHTFELFFRKAEAMGSASSMDREILRRVYWAVFITNKQLSMYFSRPPALYPQEADVKNTIRIPYPDEWKHLLDLYICKGTSSTAFEDGIPLVACWVHRVELAKILHVMIVDRQQPSLLSRGVQQVHDSLVRWLTSLPQKLQWSHWTVGQIPSYVLHLHLLFHTTMIVLHRPPRKDFDDESVNDGEGNYKTHYSFDFLPLDFVRTLALAAEVVMMRRGHDSIQHAYPCVQNIRKSVVLSMQAGQVSDVEEQAEGADRLDIDLMDLFQPGEGPFPGLNWDTGDGGSVNSAELGFLVTDHFLNEHYAWGMGHWIRICWLEGR